LEGIRPFTEETDIWEALLKESVNPLFGEGYSSFWSAGAHAENFRKSTTTL